MVTVVEQRDGSRITNCNNCDSTLRYKPSDVVQEERNHDYLGDYDLVDVITCPVCGKTTVVN